MKLFLKRVIRTFASRILAAVIGTAVMFRCYGPTLAYAEAVQETE